MSADVLAAIIVTGLVMLSLGLSILGNLGAPETPRDGQARQAERHGRTPVARARSNSSLDHGLLVRYGGALVHVDCLAARRDGRAACERCAAHGVEIGVL